jgi:hypothetical protein
VFEGSGVRRERVGQERWELAQIIRAYVAAANVTTNAAAMVIAVSCMGAIFAPVAQHVLNVT